MAKLQIKNDTITSFGGIYLIDNIFYRDFVCGIVGTFVQSSCEHCTTGCELKQLMDKKRAERRQSERKGKKRK